MYLFFRKLSAVKCVSGRTDVHKGLDHAVGVGLRERKAQIEHRIGECGTTRREAFGEHLSLVHRHGATSQRVAQGEHE